LYREAENSMNPEIGISGLILSAAITPGPNNLIVLQLAGARGWKSALPAIACIVAGGLILIALAQIGLNALISRYLWVDNVFVAMGVVYLGALGLQLVYRSFATAGSKPESGPVAPLGAPALFFLQFANPKAWVLVLTVSAAAHAVSSQLVLPVLYAVICSASLLAWAFLGQVAARVLQGGLARARFDRVMGALLIASAAALALGKI
jgi:threonine/homoserine/homoserine lactone efflux protein